MNEVLVGILVNGAIDDIEFYKKELDGCDYVISADGASNVLYKMKKVPDVIIGDMDSIEEDAKSFFLEKGVEFKRFPSKKDFTDTELSIDYAKDIGADEVVLYAAVGSRIDHSLGNINLLYYMLKRGMQGRLVNEKNEVRITDGKLVIEGRKGDLVSVIPVNGDAIGVTLTGLEYPLTDYTIEFGKTIGLSNVMVGESCRIEVKDGCIFVIKARD
ncbi:thiamine diphosphokinase [Peptoclostridium litorale]|uniref:thiamine diphosphokinase n=1 Tax=Peptoclostridium litorale TaxID=1557 RepID=UPI0006980C98|nr:thiamine diphosphokinase [Peptoclostridium litorale]